MPNIIVIGAKSVQKAKPSNLTYSAVKTNVSTNSLIPTLIGLSIPVEFIDSEKDN